MIYNILNTDNKIDFWTKGENIKISKYNLSLFLESYGVYKTNYLNEKILICISNGTIKETCIKDIRLFLRSYLESINEIEVLKVYMQNISNFVNSAFLDGLNYKHIDSDKDEKDTSSFYFNNVIAEICSNSVTIKGWVTQNKLIWKNRIINRNFNHKLGYTGQFEIFCKNLSNNEDQRFQSLKTIIGYLLHRYNNPSLAKAVILIDEDISFDNVANGRRGKSLLCRGISMCREVTFMNGKSIKSNSNFKNQRITKTTDIVFYDDVRKDFDFESLYDTITSGIVVEKKHAAETFINPEDAPKTLISSNYIVKGTNGTSDTARRCEFEVSSYYSINKSPRDEFGNNMFDDWDKDEWNLFYSFMASCVQEYLRHGLIEAKPINIRKNKLIANTDINFAKFYENNIIVDEWINKRELLEHYNQTYNLDITSNAFTRMIKSAALLDKLEYVDKSSGGIYSFILLEKTVCNTKPLDQDNNISKKKVVKLSNVKPNNTEDE